MRGCLVSSSVGDIIVAVEETITLLNIKGSQYVEGSTVNEGPRGSPPIPIHAEMTAMETSCKRWNDQNDHCK